MSNVKHGNSSPSSSQTNPLLQTKCRWITATPITRHSQTDINDHAAPATSNSRLLLAETWVKWTTSAACVDWTGPSNTVFRSWWGRKVELSRILFDNDKHDILVVAKWYIVGGYSWIRSLGKEDSKKRWRLLEQKRYSRCSEADHVGDLRRVASLPLYKWKKVLILVLDEMIGNLQLVFSNTYGRGRER